MTIHVNLDDPDDELAKKWLAEFLTILKAKPACAEGGFHHAEGAELDDARQALYKAWPAISAHSPELVSATARSLLKVWFTQNGLDDGEADDVVSEMEGGA